MANHERFCKPGRREICDICDDVDFITSSGETNIHAVLSRLTGFRSPTPGALAQHLTRHNRHDLTARLPGLPAAKPIATPSTQREEPTMNLQSVPEARPPVRYPKRNGEFINIGPECFSDEEELVICWKGRNYYADPADEVNLIAEVEALRAQVQAVREFCAATNPIRGELHMAALHGWDTAMEMVLQLLESGEIKGFAFRIANLEGRVDD